MLLSERKVSGQWSVVREKPEGGNLRLEVEELENVERLKRSYYFRFQLSVFNFQLSLPPQR